jgi:hypothetical protein
MLLGMGVAVALAGGSSATATAKPASATAKPANATAKPTRTAKPAGGAHTTVKPPSVVAHATGHKIA